MNKKPVPKNAQRAGWQSVEKRDYKIKIQRKQGNKLYECRCSWHKWSQTKTKQIISVFFKSFKIKTQIEPKKLGKQ